MVGSVGRGEDSPPPWPGELQTQYLAQSAKGRAGRWVGWQGGRIAPLARRAPAPVPGRIGQRRGLDVADGSQSRASSRGQVDLPKKERIVPSFLLRAWTGGVTAKAAVGGMCDARSENVPNESLSRLGAHFSLGSNVERIPQVTQSQEYGPRLGLSDSRRAWPLTKAEKCFFPGLHGVFHLRWAPGPVTVSPFATLGA